MKFAALLSLVLLFISCQPTTKTSGMTSEKLISLICNCAQPIVTYNDNLRALAAADNMGALSQTMTEGDDIMNTGISCITDQFKEEPKALLTEELPLLINERCDLDQRMIKDIIQKLAAFEITT